SVTAYNSVTGLRASAGGGEARCGSCLAALPGQKSIGIKPCDTKACRGKSLPVQKPRKSISVK
ncbi:MAG: hypothetical protein K2F53_01455, partial [Rikenellaceae bacterium]|nr:hypothetical protein [Rikenellaceae bacterium]